MRAAIISLHTSPLLQPGAGDSGGMNVYVRELAAALARAGVDCTTYTRADRAGLPPVVEVEPGTRVVHIEAGPHHLGKDDLAAVTDEFTDRVAEHIVESGGVDVVHGNYWLSGVVAHHLKHRLAIPMVSTFHTLARVKAEGGDIDPPWRDEAEAGIIGCSDVICVSCDAEEEQFRRLYGDPPGRLEIVAPAVEHAFFSPGSASGARRAVGLPTQRPVVLSVGRLQPLKAPDLAVRALAELAATDAHLVIVGGASGNDGDRYVRDLTALVDELDLTERVTFVPAKPHHLLSSYYRAADVVVVPSRSESFGLVALEAAACGVPVVAAAVGGLRDVVVDGVTGLLVDDRTPTAFAAAIDSLLGDPERAASLGAAASERAKSYTWSLAAARLRRIYGDVANAPRALAGACPAGPSG